VWLKCSNWSTAREREEWKRGEGRGEEGGDKGKGRKESYF
jgi:hypothetical protein